MTSEKTQDAASQTNAEPMIIGGVDAAFIGVNDVAAHLALYVGQLGWEVDQEGVLPAAEVTALWGDAIGDVPYTVLTAADAAHGRLVLLRVSDQEPPQHPRQSDTGLIAINMYTRDLDVTYRQLDETGGTGSTGWGWATPPATWEVPLNGKPVSVTQGYLEAPEGTDIVFVQPETARGTAAWDVDPARHYTELTSVVCHVPEFEAEATFWGGLGLSSWYDVSFTHPGLDAMARLPSGSVMRLSFLAGPTTARVEVTRLEDRTIGADRRSTQRTGRHLGHTGWLVKVRALDETLFHVTRFGGTVDSEAQRGSAGLFGGSRVASVNTPNGLPITFLEHTD